MHEPISKFTVRGELADSAIVTVKERITHFVETMMRDKGYVPSLDLEPQLTLDYVVERELFTFDMSVYGIWVGDEKAWTVSGITNGKEIPRYTHPVKLNQS